MILRCSDRALAETLARDNLRVSALWADLDAVQEKIQSLVRKSGSLRYYESAGYVKDLYQTEREILAQLDRIDD